MAGESCEAQDRATVLGGEGWDGGGGIVDSGEG